MREINNGITKGTHRTGYMKGPWGPPCRESLSAFEQREEGQAKRKKRGFPGCRDCLYKGPEAGGSLGMLGTEAPVWPLFPEDKVRQQGQSQARPHRLIKDIGTFQLWCMCFKTLQLGKGLGGGMEGNVSRRRGSCRGPW